MDPNDNSVPALLTRLTLGIVRQETNAFRAMLREAMYQQLAEEVRVVEQLPEEADDDCHEETARPSQPNGYLPPHGEQPKRRGRPPKQHPQQPRLGGGLGPQHQQLPGGQQ